MTRAGSPAPPGPPGELHDQVEGPLLGAEARVLQRRVGVDGRGDRDVGQVVALRDHLRAQEDRGARARELGEQPAHGAAARRARAVHAHQAGRGHEPGQRRLEPLGARALAREAGRAARRAHAGHRLRVAAVVADEAARALVVDEGDVAAGGSGRSSRSRGRGPSARTRAGWPAARPSRRATAAACSAEASGRDTGPGALHAHVDDLDRAAGRSRRAGPGACAAAARARSRGAGSRCRRRRPPRRRAARRAATWRAS